MPGVAIQLDGLLRIPPERDTRNDNL
jgi:hypothetical protein